MKAKDFYEKKLVLLQAAHDAMCSLATHESRADAPDDDEQKFFDETCDSLDGLVGAVVTMVDMHGGDR